MNATSSPNEAAAFRRVEFARCFGTGLSRIRHGSLSGGMFEFKRDDFDRPVFRPSAGLGRRVRRGGGFPTSSVSHRFVLDRVCAFRPPRIPQRIRLFDRHQLYDWAALGAAVACPNGRVHAWLADSTISMKCWNGRRIPFRASWREQLAATSARLPDFRPQRPRRRLRRRTDGDLHGAILLGTVMPTSGFSGRIGRHGRRSSVRHPWKKTSAERAKPNARNARRQTSASYGGVDAHARAER